MGNCQAAEAATVVIQHPAGNKVERIYRSINAQEVMSANPGHYVALVIGYPTARTENGTPVKQLKLLRPNDTLLMGQVYRLVSFEDVLKQFANKKCVKLGKLLKESGGLVDLDTRRTAPRPTPNSHGIRTSIKNAHEVYGLGSSGSSGSGMGSASSSSVNRGLGRHHASGRQWKPALQSIAEIGT